MGEKEKEMLIINIKVTPDDLESKNYFCNEDECGGKVQFQSEKSLKVPLKSYLLLKMFADFLISNFKKHLFLFHFNSSIEQFEDSRSAMVYRYSCPFANCVRSLKMEKEYFTSRKHLRQHYLKVHSVAKFACDCGQKFSTEVFRNLHMKDCGKLFTCHCLMCFNSNDALISHQKKKHPTMVLARKAPKNLKSKKCETSPMTRTVSTTTSGLGLWNSSENPAAPSTTATTSVFTSTDQLISSITFESKSTTTNDVTLLPIPKLIRNSSTSTAEDFIKEENSNSLSSSSSQNKKNLNWSVTGADFDDSINIFDSDVKMEFYTAETQTDFNENLFLNNYTQTTFADLYDFEKFDIQTQTNWDE